MKKKNIKILPAKLWYVMKLRSVSTALNKVPSYREYSAFQHLVKVLENYSETPLTFFFEVSSSVSVSELDSNHADLVWHHPRMFHTCKMSNAYVSTLQKTLETHIVVLCIFAQE